jgi:hypothetical protein
VTVRRAAVTTEDLDAFGSRSSSISSSAAARAAAP